MKRLNGLFFALCIVLTSSISQQKSFMFVFLNTNPNKPELPKEQVDSLMSGHMANISRLAEEGKIVAAGPFYGGGGIFVMATASQDSAWEWLKTDPAIRANRWIIELLPYHPRRGSVCAVGENYEMTTYHFVRFTVREVTSPQKAHEAWTTHDRYIGTFSPADSVVAEGILGDRQSAILVFKGEGNEEFIRTNPAVQEGVLEATIRKIYIARGSFCEKD